VIASAQTRANRVRAGRKAAVASKAKRLQTRLENRVAEIFGDTEPGDKPVNFSISELLTRIRTASALPVSEPASH
jgi:hypothetical protein